MRPPSHERPLEQRPEDEPHLFFVRGKTYPRAIAWLGFRSFWGHLWHLAASVIATEDIDARDWMRPQPPDELTRLLAATIGAGGAGPTLCDALGRDLWVDYVADTGDDADVSAAVADLIFRAHVVGGEELPRGDVLVWGGDTAYPVATEMEIHNRVCVPFNRVLRERQDGKPRALLGIPGNHDWYDGLDGFARMFRARRGRLDRVAQVDDTADTGGQIAHFIDWVEAFRAGHFVAKRPALPLAGYTPVQAASYFALALAPGLDLWAVDRQLRAVDFGQRMYFLDLRERAPETGLVVLLPDPVYSMLEPYALGQRIFQALELGLERDRPLVLSGDTHHYCRQHFGGALHVIAGGGGAFLHPARIARRGMTAPAAEFPGPRASLALALQVPWQIANGRAGFMVHAAAALLYLPVLGLELGGNPTATTCAVVALVAWLVCGMLGGWRKRRPFAIGALAAGCAAWIGLLPWMAHDLVAWLGAGRLGATLQAFVAYGLSIYPAALGFGTYLMVLTIFGLEQHQAFSALAHPGYKHFMRLRVRRDGSAVDGWVVGKVDTLDPESPVLLVDRWTWNNPTRRSPT
jgi:hypothetical protein